MNTINPNGESLRRACAVMFAGLLLGAASSLAQAAPAASDVRTIAVQYSDLNLATEDGAHRLYGRIVTAARAVCETEDTRDLAALVASRTCESAAIARAVSEVDSPLLAAALATHTSHG
jgi:UrcA family protein